jgi:hydroxymethylbilane synthase
MRKSFDEKRKHMLPIALRPDGRRAVIVGAGNVAARKAAALVDAGFPIFVVAPSIDEQLRMLASDRNCAKRPYESKDVAGAALVVAATGDDAVNARVVSDARAAGVLVCDATDPERGDFHMTATVRRGDVTLSVDSGGASPAFSRRIADVVAAGIGQEYGDAARALGRMRAYAQSILPDARRSAVLRALAALPVAELGAMDDAAAQRAVEAANERLRDEQIANATRTVVCASRASALAMTQTRAVAARLAAHGIATRILPVSTTGDRQRDRAIDRLGSVNVFVTELESALRDRRADYAVHSCKDLPSELADDMRIAAVSAREDPRDAFCSERYSGFDALPPGARVGTSSPRRRVQLAALRPDIHYEDLRGNVDTRLRKLREGRYDAIVVAMAGLNRLRTRASYTVAFGVDVIVPAVAQGALAAETRRDEGELAGLLAAAINDSIAELCVCAERAALRALRAGCGAPVGVHAVPRDGGRLHICIAYAASVDSPVRRIQISGPAATVEAAEALGAQAAGAIVGERTARRVLLPRTRERPSDIARALREEGVEVVELRAGDDGPDPAERPVDMVLFPSSGAVAAAGSYLKRLREVSHRPAIVAMGPASAQAARAAGYAPDAVSADASIPSFVALVRRRLQA